MNEIKDKNVSEQFILQRLVDSINRKISILSSQIVYNDIQSSVNDLVYNKKFYQNEISKKEKSKSIEEEKLINIDNELEQLIKKNGFLNSKKIMFLKKKRLIGATTIKRFEDNIKLLMDKLNAIEYTIKGNDKIISNSVGFDITVIDYCKELYSIINNGESVEILIDDRDRLLNQISKINEANEHKKK